MASRINGHAKWFGRWLLQIAGIGFILWQLNLHLVNTTVEARVGPTEAKVEMLEHRLTRIEAKLDRALGYSHEPREGSVQE